MIGRQLDSMNEMEDFLTKQCQDIDYTIVRPPRLLDEPLKGMLNHIQSLGNLGLLIMKIQFNI